MIPQLFALFCFGVVISLVVFVGIVQAREFQRRQMVEQAVDATPQPVAFKQNG